MRPLLDDAGALPLVVVLRAPTAERFGDVGRVLADAGVGALEVTMTTAGAADSIRALRASVPDGVLVGAGTVRSAEQLDAAADAGAAFAVSQVASRAVADRAAARGIPYIPGALTPTEIVAAWDLGVGLVKVSPIGPVGGLAYLRELTGPLPDVALFPTGGVLPREAAAYLASGASVIGLSGHLLEDALDGGDLAALAARTRRVVEDVTAEVGLLREGIAR